MSVDEAVTSGLTPLAGDLRAGVEAISAEQQITFTKYVRLILPLDGFVFWVRADLATPPQVPLPTLVAAGSLHYATDTQQDETETYNINRVVFTSTVAVQDLNEVDSAVLWIAEFDGIRFAFSTRGSFYQQSNLYHYVGNAIYSDMASQVIDDITQLSTRQVVSNSLPIWLSLNTYVPFYGIVNPGFTLYPSFLLPTNIIPPFAAVHIDPTSTQPLVSAPWLGTTLSRAQLVREKVLITTYGARNDDILNFIDFVAQFTLDEARMGVTNIPVPRDEKRPQSELNAISQKKTIEFEVNYLQSVARNIAQQLIVSAVPTYRIGDL